MLSKILHDLEIQFEDGVVPKGTIKLSEARISYASSRLEDTKDSFLEAAALGSQKSKTACFMSA